MPGFTRPTADDECEECGAKLPAPDAEGNRTCRYCGTVKAAPPVQQPQVNVIVTPGITFPRTTVPTIPSSSSEGVSTGAKAGCGLFTVFIVLIIVASVGVPLYFGLKAADVSFPGLGSTGSGSSSSAGYRVEGDSVLALPGEPAAPVEVVTYTSRYDRGSSKNVHELVRVNSGGGSPTWVAGGFGADTYRVPLAADGARVYTADGAQLRALTLDAGTTVWQRPLSDNLSLPCDDCFVLVGNHIVARTADGTVTALDAATGQPAWSRRLQDTLGRVIGVGGHLLILDSTGGSSALSLVDPVTGTDLAVLQPTCPNTGGSFARSISRDALVLPSLTGDAVFVGFSLLPACWQRFDLATGSPAWSVSLEEGYLDSGAYGFVAPSGLFFAGRERELLGRIGTEDGSFIPIAPRPDLDSVPIAANDTTLVLRAKTSRGTEKWSLWGLDLASGAPRWDFSLGPTSVADPPDAETIFLSDGEKRFTAHLDGTTLHVVTYQAGANQFTIDTIDTTTGVAATPKTVAGAAKDTLPHFSVVTWRGARAVLVVGNELVVVDTTTGSLTQTWP